MSGLMHWAKYNKTLIALKYGTSGSKISSSSSFGQKGTRLASRVWTTIEVFEGFNLSLLKRRNTLCV